MIRTLNIIGKLLRSPELLALNKEGMDKSQGLIRNKALMKRISISMVTRKK
jgi:hypothetical protein